jgi:cytochrome c553
MPTPQPTSTMMQAKKFLLALGAALGSLMTVPMAAQAQDVAAGERKAAMCIGCHGIPGYQASFPEVHRVPMISGQTAAYIVASLQAYKKGDRRHPTMRSLSVSLSDEDMADLAAFYAQHGAERARAVADTPARAPTPVVAALLERGACASCHGVNFNKPLVDAYPKIAGQHADYLLVALRSYRVQGNHLIGRNNGIMAGVVTPFTHAELKLMADYIASLPGDLRVVPQPRLRTASR